jgi:hypothetical protein
MSDDSASDVAGDTVEVDVLVVGSGAAGMTAALVGRLEGLAVLLCEKSAQVGGTSATSAGTIWVPGTRQSREAGHKDDVADVRRYLDSVIGPATDDRREAYLSTGPEVVDYLERRSEVKFTPYRLHPDYLANRPGATAAGRPLAPVPFDGRLLGKDFAKVRAPIGEFMALGGMMIGRDDIEPGTISGSSVLFQATTDDVPNTTQVEFFANGVSLGVDTTPDAGGVFEIVFDSTLFPNASLSLKAVATFAGGGTAEDLVSVSGGKAGRRRPSRSRDRASRACCAATAPN